jgi:hypothetical protein
MARTAPAPLQKASWKNIFSAKGKTMAKLADRGR